jgi:methylated-DNA-[protein]-cysteine S-methyltransferase
VGPASAAGPTRVRRSVSLVLVRCSEMSFGFTLFDTAIGRCAIAWNDVGIVALQLPERDEAATLARLRRRLDDLAEAAPPPALGDAITAVVSLLAGNTADLSAIAIDLGDLPEFDRRVYEATRTIPVGTTRTYGAIASAMGDPAAARAVGQALGANPIAVIVPCHRVVASTGDLGGFSAHGGTDTKRRLLHIEGYQAAAPQLALFEV